MTFLTWAHGFFAQGNGIELPLLYLTAALAIAFAGAGSCSLDALVGLAGLSRPTPTWAAVAARRPTPAPAP